MAGRYRSAAGRAGREILGEARTVAKVEELAATFAAYADREAETWAGHPSAPRGVACRSGCSTCCTALIVTTIPEVVRIASTILDGWSDEALEVLRDRIDSHEATHRAPGVRDRRRLGHPCPLLDADGACSIHPFRPLLCRGWVSLDVGRCLAFAADRWAGVEIPTDPVRRTIAESIAAGSRDALGAEGLGHSPVELVAALRIILDDPTAVDRWLAGEPAFREAEMAAEGPEVHWIGIAG